METKKQYNIGILAHVDAGKTTITEQLLLLGGSIRSAGSVDSGTAQTDWLDVERRRGISVKTACAQIEYRDAVIRLVDTPGHVDFAAEVARSLQILDAAVLVISGAEGVQAHTKTIFKALQQMKIPTLIAVNKIDRAGFSANALEEQIRKQLTDRLLVLQAIGKEAEEECEIFTAFSFGSSDLTQNGTSASGQSKRSDDGVCDAVREQIFAQLAEVDEEMEGMYLEETTPSADLLKEKTIDACQKGTLVPVVYLCAKEGTGIRELADTVITCLPDASRRKTEQLGGIVFQITHDPVMGKAAHIRLFGGSLTSRAVVPIQGKKPEEWEKATQIRTIQGGKFLDTGRMEAGEIAAVYGLSTCSVGDVIGELETVLDSVAYMKAQPLLLIRAEPEDNAKEMELAAALTQLSEEDPLLQYERNPLTKQMYLRVMGTVQIEILQELLLSRFGLSAIFSKPQVVYKEKPGKTAVGQEVYTMPKPCWAVVELQIEPLPEGSGIVFESVIKEKTLPYRYQNHVRASLYDTFQQGIYGWEVMDAKVTLIGGQHHHVHTHPLDFFVATPIAALRALTNSGSVLMEPYMKVTLSGGEELIGRVLGDILVMRGEFSSPVMEEGIFTLEAVMPLKDCMEYPVTFHSLTSGRGTCTMEFDSWRPCEKGMIETLPRRGVDPLDRAKWILSCRSAY
ncbi:MAG: TetM/TetW/TetO/TetS family tetracycline resistance ribosomal protection protein [Lachnospiraceae bacterium]|nr:TetM/TetW/TetO/TetS family tetracycline resistance ribosomal protection protein [Lachnospiraceae bacterium]